MNQVLFCMQALQNQLCCWVRALPGAAGQLINYHSELRTSHLQAQVQWADNLPCIHTQQPRENKIYSLLIRNISPDPKMRGGLVYSDSENSSTYSSFPCSHSLSLPSSPSGRNPKGPEDPARKES